MKTKTWKIGEYCKGGIITVEIHGKVISIIGKDWDVSKGYTRSSNQSGAKEFIGCAIRSTDRDAEYLIEKFLVDLTTPYWADKIIEWIKSKVTLS